VVQQRSLPLGELWLARQVRHSFLSSLCDGDWSGHFVLLGGANGYDMLGDGTGARLSVWQSCTASDGARQVWAQDEQSRSAFARVCVFFVLSLVQSVGNVIDPINLIEGQTLESMIEAAQRNANKLSKRELDLSINYLKKEFPQATKKKKEPFFFSPRSHISSIRVCPSVERTLFASP